MKTHLLSPCPASLHFCAFFLNFWIIRSDLKPSQSIVIKIWAKTGGVSTLIPKRQGMRDDIAYLKSTMN